MAKKPRKQAKPSARKQAAATGRQTLMKDPLGNRTSWQYDAANRQTVRIDGRGLRTSYLYDNSGRLTGQKYQDGTRATMSYDAVGQRLVLSDWTGRTSSTFDADGRTTLVINPAGLRLSYAWDAIGQRSSLNTPGGRFSYVHDDGSRIRRLTNPEGDITSWSYDAASRVTVNRLANGVRASFSYDDANQVLRLANVNSAGTTLSSFGYLYDKVGNRTRVVEANGDRVSWIYDNLNQLTAERRSGANAYANTYAYDPVGNRTRMLKSATPTTYLYDVANQLTRFQDSTGYATNTFDGSGNLARTLNPSNQRTTNTWDGENRLTKVVLPSGVRNTFVYNGDGLRVQKQDSTGTTKHDWDQQNIILETDGRNIIQVVYTLEPVLYGNLISQRRGGVSSFYLFDGLGSTDRLGNTSGTVTDSYLYRAFGSVTVLSGATVNPFRYVGRTGYYYYAGPGTCWLRGRVFDPESGRFLSQDFDLDLSVYVYCYNDPLTCADPSGRQPTPVLPPIPIKFPLPWGYLCGPVVIKRGPQIGKYCNWISWLACDCCVRSQVDHAKACCAESGKKLYSCTPNSQGPGYWLECNNDKTCEKHYEDCQGKWGSGPPGRSMSQCGDCFSRCLINDGVWPTTRDCDYRNFPGPPRRR
jgi:RHS repeat-associated protein